MVSRSLPIISSPGEISFATADLPDWQRKAIKVIEKGVGKKQLMRKYHQFLESNRDADTFWDDVIDCLKLRVSTFGTDPEQIPGQGPLVVVANHPFGLIDGATICWLLSQRRKDFKVILWDVFDKKNNGDCYFLPLDLAEDCKQARRQNLQIRKTAINHLRDDGAILIFPSGSAERVPHLFGKPYELPWLPFTEKLILASKASVLPVFVHGHNSPIFHIASTISETLRRAMFYYEIKRRISTELELSLGDLVEYNEIESWSGEKEITPELRELTLALASTKDTQPKYRLLPHYSHSAL